MNSTTTIDLDDLAFRLFKLLAQFEYSLKAMGYASSKANGSAEADWDRFANEVGNVLLVLDTPSVVAARTYLLDHPPRRQVLLDGHLGWESVPTGDRSVQALFGHVRRVRNNLYHGGKFNAKWLDPDRSRDLVAHVLALLDELPAHNPQLRDALMGNVG